MKSSNIIYRLKICLAPGLDLVTVLWLPSQLTHHRHEGWCLVVPVDPGAVVVKVGGELVVDRLGRLQVRRVPGCLGHPGLGKAHLVVVVGAPVHWRRDRVSVLSLRNKEWCHKFMKSVHLGIALLRYCVLMWLKEYIRWSLTGWSKANWRSCLAWSEK